MCVAVRLAAGWWATAVAGVELRERGKERQKERDSERESLTDQEQQKDRVHEGESV